MLIKISQFHVFIILITDCDKLNIQGRSGQSSFYNKYVLFTSHLQG